jgi:S-DNA-T family DNA segregation ATPase FtsK/SpoIIIE
VFDAEASALRKDAVGRGDVAGYMVLSRQRNERVKNRLILSGGIGLASVTATTAAGWVYPVAPWAVLFVALVLLGWNGRRADRPLIDSAIISAPGARKLTADMVVRTCIAAKLCTDADPITFVAPGVHRDGEGFRAVFDLPYGSKAATAIKRIEDLAAGLDVDEGRVFVDRVRGDTGSARRVALWVADRDP